MRLLGFFGAAILISTLGITLPANAQHGNHGNQGDRQDRREDRGEHGKWKKDHGNPHMQPRPGERVGWEQHRAVHWKNEHRGWKERGGYHGYRVPHDRYVVYFGRAHRFRVHTYPVVVVSGRPRFHYHDCWITLVDPYPEYWGARWYETDDVYVEYVNDGYYMYNTRHPGVAIAVNISL